MYWDNFAYTCMQTTKYNKKIVTIFMNETMRINGKSLGLEWPGLF